MKLTCSKRYDDLPFAHRQPSHDGHCAWVHGHNWGFEFEFRAKELDECGFVVDFGKLKWLKEWINERFDHTLVLNEDDPWLGHLQFVLGGLKDEDKFTLDMPMLAKILVVPDCSSEGLCAYLLHECAKVVSKQTNGRVSLYKVTVIEDSKNHATIYAQ